MDTTTWLGALHRRISTRRSTLDRAWAWAYVAQAVALAQLRIEGTRAARFTVAQLHSAASVRQVDSPERQRLAAERDTVNGRIEELRLRKEQTEEAAYLAELEKLLLELAVAEEKIEAVDGAAEPAPGAASGGGNAP